LSAWEIEAPVHVFVALLDALPGTATAKRTAAVPGRFPPVRRDLAFFVPEKVTHQELADVLRESAGDWLVSLELFDVYAGSGTPAGMKSLAFALQFQDPQRTLAENEVQLVQDRMTAAVAQRLSGRLRER
jgi:phenylalanyl-tRNA synthetase beta chain